MQIIEQSGGGFFVHARHGAELLYGSRPDLFQGAEGFQQSLPALDADLRRIVQKGLGLGFLPQPPVIGNGEAMGFVAYPLQQFAGFMIFRQAQGLALTR